MSRRQSYPMSDLPGHSLDTSDISDHDENHHPSNRVEDPFQPGASSTTDLVQEGRRPFALADKYFDDGWAWEILAWLLAAISLLALIIVFAIFNSKALAQWKSGIMPNTLVSVLSSIGQTAILAPVTACVSQSMWLWLNNKGLAARTQNHGSPSLIDMQGFDEGSRGPLSSLFLLRKHPGSCVTRNVCTK